VLNSYLQRTQQLLADIKQEIFTPLFLTGFINTARGQIAGESKCIRYIGSISTVTSQRNYSFASISTVSGVQGTFSVRTIEYGVASGQKWIEPRGWAWFNFYYMNNPVPQSGPPQRWAQLGQGLSGTFYLDPPPDQTYTLYCDAIGNPAPITTDTAAEIIPYQWTDAVPYFAAYLCYLYAQHSDRADGMLNLYEKYMTMARRAATPDVGMTMYPQNIDPAQISKLGLTARQQQGSG
jgi:hypothetical protein